MHKKIKKAFENAVWWSGVVMVGLVLGISLQFVKAWTEPTTTPPGGNVGAPINTGDIYQEKNGLLGANGLLTSWFYKVPHPELGESNAVNSVLKLADPITGQAAWAAGSGGKYQISCSISGALTMCCRVDTEIGTTECKMTPDHPNPWIKFQFKPWE